MPNGDGPTAGEVAGDKARENANWILELDRRIETLEHQAAALDHAVKALQTSNKEIVVTINKMLAVLSGRSQP